MQLEYLVIYSKLRTERLETDEALELLTEYKATGNMEIREQLILACMPMVKNTARRMSLEFDVDMDDMISEGITAVIETIENVEIVENLFGYAKLAVMRKMWKSDLINCSGVIRIPEKAKYEIPGCVSSDLPVGDSGDTTLGEFIGDPDGDHTDRISLKVDMDSAMSKLSETDRAVVTMHLVHEMPRPKIAEILSISERNFRTRLTNALNRLQGLLAEYNFA